jgi:ribosomal protein S6--L-glutamate ligase
MCAALRAAGADAFTFSLAACLLDLGSGAVWHDGQDLGTLDAVVVKKLGATADPLTPPRVNLLRHLEDRGVRCFSPASAIADANDRCRMTQRLAQAGLPIPATVVTEDIDEAAEIVQRWGRAVLKPLFTSKGRGMMLLAGNGVLRLRLRRWRREWSMPFYLQEYVVHPGRDIGVGVLGGEVLGAYYRVGRPDAWLTTTSAGGHYEPCPVTAEVAELAIRAAGAFGLDFTGVDLVESPRGLLLYEVSAFGGFAGLWQTQQLDAAAHYATYVLRRLGGEDPDERPARRSEPVSA